MRWLALALLGCDGAPTADLTCDEARQYLEVTEHVGELTFTAQQLLIELGSEHPGAGITLQLAYDGGIVQWVRATGDEPGCENRLEVGVTLKIVERDEQQDAVLWATEVDRAVVRVDAWDLDAELTPGAATGTLAGEAF